MNKVLATFFFAFLFIAEASFAQTNYGSGLPHVGGPSIVPALPNLPDPVLAWDFNEQTGTTTADNGTAPANTGTLNNAIWTTSGFFHGGVECRVGQSSDSITTPDVRDLDITGDLTMMGWFFPLDVETTWTFAMGKVASSPPYFMNTVNQNATNDAPYARVDTDFGFFEAVHDVQIAQDDWTHLAMVHDTTNDELRFYINGVLEVTTAVTATATLDTNNNNFQVCENLFDGQEFEGRVDEVRIYDVVLDVNQINDAKDNERWISTVSLPDLPDPVLAWDFNEQTGTTTEDNGTAPANTGTLNNAIWTTSGFFQGGVECRVGQSSDSITTPDASDLDITGDLTMMGWFFPLDVETTWTFAMGKVDSVNMPPSPPYFMNTVNQNATNDAPYARIDTDFGFFEAVHDVQIPQDDWTHLAMVHDTTNDELRFYIDGVLEVTTAVTATATLDTNNDNFQVCENLSNGQEFEGRVDEVRIYDVVLDVNQINDAKDNEGWQ